MTPPLTDTELLAYIERTTGLKVLILPMLPLGMPLVDRYGKMLWRVRSIAYEFYAHEQRVREEAAQLCDRFSERKMSAAECASALRAWNGSTAPQLSTAADRLAPSPEGAGQGEAAEAIGRAWFADEPVPINFKHEPKDFAEAKEMLKRMRQFLIKQGGK